jgi:hypothetical protein
MAKKNNGDSEQGSIKSDKKQKLFIPRNLGYNKDNRYFKWNLKQTTKSIDGKEVRINQFDLDGNKHGYWMSMTMGHEDVKEGYYVNNEKHFELSDLDVLLTLQGIKEKLFKLETSVSNHHWELQNCIRFCLEGEQIAFKMWQMNIPSVGETVGIKFLEEDPNLEYVRHFFIENENTDLLNVKSQANYGESKTGYYFFKVVEVSCIFTEGEGFDNDSGCEYLVDLTPKLKK